MLKCSERGDTWQIPGDQKEIPIFNQELLDVDISWTFSDLDGMTSPRHNLCANAKVRQYSYEHCYANIGPIYPFLEHSHESHLL